MAYNIAAKNPVRVYTYIILMISYYLDLTFVYLCDNMSNIITHNIYSFVESMNSLRNYRFSPQSILNAYLLFDVLGANV